MVRVALDSKRRIQLDEMCCARLGRPTRHQLDETLHRLGRAAALLAGHHSSQHTDKAGEMSWSTVAARPSLNVWLRENGFSEEVTTLVRKGTVAKDDLDKKFNKKKSLCRWQLLWMVVRIADRRHRCLHGVSDTAPIDLAKAVAL